jgi:hypothetical protein
MGKIFSVHTQTSTEVHPASLSMGNESLPGGKVIEHPPASSIEVKERIRLKI